MKAIFKHELSSFFHSLTGYIFGAGLLFFAGIYCLVYNLSGGLPYFEFVLGGMGFVFLLIVPILTMRVLADEQRQKTSQLLYSLPVSLTEIVLGKYFAMLVMLLLPLGIVCVYPLILSAFGDVYLPTAFGAILAFFLLGATLIAIGTFISSLVDNPLIAAAICVVVMLLNYFLYALASFVSGTAFASYLAFVIVSLLLGGVFLVMTKNITFSAISAATLVLALTVWYLIAPSGLSGLFPSVMRKLSLYERFYNFVGGVFDLTAVIYFISVSAVFLLLTVQSLERRRWGE